MSSRRDHFWVDGSPLKGLLVPRDWHLLDLAAKRRALVVAGIAESFGEACSLLGKHAAAVAAGKRARRAEWIRRCAELKRRVGDL